MRDERQLDRQIDAALSTYAEPAPGSAFEERLLAGLHQRIASEHSSESGAASKKNHWASWTIGLATAAGLLAIVFSIHRLDHRPISVTQQTHSPAKNPEIALAIPGKVADPAKSGKVDTLTHHKQTHAQSAEKIAPALPRLDVFPTPAPLDESSEALAFFVQRAPANEVQELLKAEARADQPVTIPELEIPPLESLDEGGR